MKLHYKTIGSGRPVIILHGLFGSGDNWITMAKALAAHGFQVFLVDQRNHGRSDHDSEMNYSNMAADLQELIIDHDIEKPVLLGHSMGGKTVMWHSYQHPEVAEKLIVVDIAPRQYPPHHQHIFEALHLVDLEKISSRKEVEVIISNKIQDRSVIFFLLKNLYWDTADKLAWRFNLNAIEQNINSIGDQLLFSTVITTPVLFIRGGNSDYINLSDERYIDSYFSNSEILTIEGAGHWVHADQPERFLAAVLNYIK